MAHEQTQAPWKKPSPIPEGLDWPSLMKRDGDELETHYRHVLEKLGKQTGMLGIIFRKAQNKIQDPAKLRRLMAELRRVLDLVLCLSKDDAEHPGLLPELLQDVPVVRLKLIAIPLHQARPVEA